VVTDRWLAVPRSLPESMYVEDSRAAVEFSKTRAMPIDYYRIELDSENVPSLRKEEPQ
jgi:hypothetical protein